MNESKKKMNMTERFTKEPFMDRIRDTGYLLKNSFKVIGKDKDIIKPTIRMVAFSIVLIILFFISLFLFLSETWINGGIFLFVILIFVFVPFKFFYDIRQKANQSWIVYNTICGKDISYSEAHNHTYMQKSSLRKIALIDLLIGYVGSQREERRGFISFFINLFLAALTEIWDLLRHYMIPAVVVEQKPLREIIPQIKSLKNNVPAALVGVFGIDFVGNVIKLILGPIYLLILALSVGIGYLFAPVWPNTLFLISGFSFSWVPIIVALFLVSILGAIMQRIVESTKIIYFTIFYTVIRAPTNIRPDMRVGLTRYLSMEK